MQTQFIGEVTVEIFPKKMFWKSLLQKIVLQNF